MCAMRYINKGPFGIQDTYKADIKAAGQTKYPDAQMRAKAKEMLSYTYNNATGRFSNVQGDEVNTAKEAIELNKELDAAFSDKPQQLELPFNKPKIDKPADVETMNKALNKYRLPNDQIPTNDNTSREFQSSINKPKPKYRFNLAEDGKDNVPTPKPSKFIDRKTGKFRGNDLDLMYYAADPREKANMRKEFKGRYNFNTGKFVENTMTPFTDAFQRVVNKKYDEPPKQEVKQTSSILDLPEKSPQKAQPKVEEDVETIVKRLSDERANRERQQIIKTYGDGGLAAALLQQKGLLDE